MSMEKTELIVMDLRQVFKGVNIQDKQMKEEKKSRNNQTKTKTKNLCDKKPDRCEKKRQHCCVCMWKQTYLRLGALIDRID